MLQIANPGSEGDSGAPVSADTITSATTEDALDRRAVQEAAEYHADALEGISSHAGEEES